MKLADETIADACLFFISLVPLKLFCEESQVMWYNPVPSSTRFCRPIRLQFFQKNTETSVNEAAYFEDQIKHLVPYDTVITLTEVLVSFELALTKINGKICNAITATKSTQRCYMCNATWKQFNDIESI